MEVIKRMVTGWKQGAWGKGGIEERISFRLGMCVAFDPGPGIL